MHVSIMIQIAQMNKIRIKPGHKQDKKLRLS